MAKPTLPFTKRVTAAVDNIGRTNGTVLPTPPTPPELEGKNEATSDFISQHTAMAELLVSSLVKKHAEARYERAKTNLLAIFPDFRNLVVGDNKTYPVGNVALNVRIQRGQTRIDRQKLLTNLMVKQKMSLDEATAFVAEVENVGSNVMYLSPSTIAE